MSEQQLYDRIGVGYASQRRADTRWAAAIRAAVGDATNVLNVGAGAGSYEPTDVPVIALEPSRRMLSQRPPTAAPAVAAIAEAIPFPEGAFDAALAILTLHHWTDWHRGLAEVKRVTRRRIVVVTADVFRDDEPFWIKDYFPEIQEWDKQHMQPVRDVREELWPSRVEALPVAADFTDGCCAAYWRRPDAYLDPAVRAGISGFSLIPPEAVTRGLTELERPANRSVDRAVRQATRQRRDRYRPSDGDR